ncbi:sigma-54-dependent transcriptional regulator [Sulfurisoma sediminicola]|uniref:Two-component system response regulator PilR (NtrC family) n=1 Tax=Sulfurisoma sediminicola TaxID=1381557 RepID=A0A497XD57_9PROT|nr:sigma-54 dependent transcriptional regulator [Sulfurisoma sediminicola]RLJ63811.1 two-component system response regulator PilR (NtrC family) [Sulfurisoma sediminicola]
MSNPRRNRSELIRALVVDDEADIRELLDMTLARMGLAADSAATLAEAKRLLAAGEYQICLTDMRLPDGDGLELVRYVGEQCPELPVAVITAHGSMGNAVAALKAGAFDYLSKPVSLEQLRVLVRSALDLPSGVSHGGGGEAHQLLGASPAVEQVRHLIDRVGRSQAPVYISGESGSGKELAARLIHERSSRAERPFVPVNCGAIPGNLVESEFFGYRKGAFTGADSDRSGFFQAADGGTLFLDEVADLPLTMQVKLLRAIQEKRVRKVGATTEEAVDVRIICATHQNLRALVEQGAFRQDLFYRLNVIEIRMPALRECREDIPLLTDHVLGRLAKAAGGKLPDMTAAARRALEAYPFPGNVRELENTLERAMALLVDDRIDVADLGLATESTLAVESPQPGQASLQDYLDAMERQAILDALEKTRFNRTAAARLLGITFRSLRYRMQRLGLND